MPDDDSESKRILKQLYDLFTNHLVAVVLKVSRTDGSTPSGRNVFPGFLLECRGRWFYLTAGHIFRRVEAAIQQGSIRIDGAVFVDYFSPNAKSRTLIRFDFADLPRFYIDEDKIGFDLGGIELSPYFVRQFEANGIVPLREENWLGQDLTVYEGFFVLGFPEEKHGDSFTYGPHPMLEPTLIPLQWIPNPPEDITKGRKALFCANFPERLPIGMEGASGGPIFGVTNKPEFAYQMVAMQFAQWEAQHVVVGCIMPAIGYLLTRWIEKADAGAASAPK